MRCALIAMLAIATLWLENSLGDDVVRIPLKNAYATTGQTDAKDLWKELKDVTNPLFGGWLADGPAVFFVTGKDLPSAVKASRSSLKLISDTEDPQPAKELRLDGPLWVGAYIGSTGSRPPAYQVESIEVQEGKVRVAYRSVERGGPVTTDYHPYLIWAPLEKLKPGEYTLELYDSTKKKAVATHKCKLVEP